VDKDSKELNEIMESGSSKTFSPLIYGAKEIHRRGKDVPAVAREGEWIDLKKEDENLDGLCQWNTQDNKTFIPSARTKKLLIPGVYEIHISANIGLYFKKIDVRTEGLLRFPDSNSDKVVSEIQNFWQREHLFKEYDLTYKRGMLLWGPPGSGKSCTIQLIIQDVIQRGGVVIKFTDPNLFKQGIRIFREIQEDTPFVVIMEDIDSILEIYNESEVLNILDGVEQVQKCVFLATTNYPQNLGGRIVNRPSRFDKRFKIGFPSAESRRMYFEHLIGKDRIKDFKIDLDKWVEDTEEFSIAHLKELFIAVVILDDNYADAVETLQSMKEEIDVRENSSGFGFLAHKNNKVCRG
jgi:hypothetical protein